MNKTSIQQKPTTSLPPFLADLQRPHVCACPCGQRFEHVEAMRREEQAWERDRQESGFYQHEAEAGGHDEH